MRIAQMLAHYRAILASRQDIIIGMSQTVFGELNVKFFQQLGDIIL
jgi:hypothetical protein